MPIAEQNIVYGSYTSDGLPRNLDLGFMPHEFHLWNETQQASIANPAVVKEAWYIHGQAVRTAYSIMNTAGAATDEHIWQAAGGFETYSGVEEELEAAIVGAGATNATPVVVTSAGHNYEVGDIVRMYTTTGMLQIAGLDFVVTAQTAGVSFTLGTIPGATFAAVATAATSRRVRIPRAFAPKQCIITNITAANPGVITTNIPHGYANGDRVRIRVPVVSGMVQLNDRIVTVTVITATTFSIGVDTTAFTAFAWPTSLQAAAGCERPICVPVGELGQALTDATNNASFQGISIGPIVVGANADVIRWRAIRGDHA